MKHLLIALLAAVSAFAGPPLICHRVDIGDAKSLPWVETKDWDGAQSHYDLARLNGDTLALLTPTAPLNVRMETLRRAAIYAAKKEGLSDHLTAMLLARTANSEASGKPDAMAWFDAGYFVEALRQMSFIQAYRNLTPGEQAHFEWHSSIPFDGKPWIDRAARLGAKGLEVAFVKIEEYRRVDLQRLSAKASPRR